MSSEDEGTGLRFGAYLERERVATYLEELANSLRAGTVVVRHGDQVVTLSPGEGLEMALEAAEKKGQQKLRLALEWEAPRETRNVMGGPLIIGHQGPTSQPPSRPEAFGEPSVEGSPKTGQEG